ncbi:MAG: trigger factor [Holophagales bacterium]|jgi:trigger factor|nr:trigger factor [Holophagales bacterium]
MQVNLIHNSATRKTLEMIFPAATVAEAFDSAVKEIAPKVKMPGFRPGKVPKSVLVSKYQNEITGEVSEKLVETHFWDAAANIGISPISRPAIEKAEVRDGAEGKVRVQFDVAPEVKLPDYKGAALVKKKQIIDEEFINDRLQDVRENAVKLVPVEEGAEVGHIVALDIKTKPQGMKAKYFSDQKIALKDGRPFDAEILGLKIDDTKKFTIQVPQNDADKTLAGKQVHYEVRVLDIRSKVLPELNDEFAKDLGQHETLQGLIDEIRKESEELAEAEAMARLQSNLLDQLLDASTFEVPGSMVNLQLDDYCREFMDTLARRGIRPRQVNWAAYRRHRLVDAERAVRTGYLLQALGNAEDIQVSNEEVDEEIRKWIEQSKSKESFESIKASIEKSGGTAEIRGRVRTDKIFDMLLKSATVTEELLDKKAYEELLEMERRRDEGIAQARFDAGGLAGGNLAEQDGGEPEAVVPADKEASDESKPIEEAPPKRGRKKAAEVDSEEAENPAEAPASKRTKKVVSEPEPEEPEEKPKRAKKAETAKPNHEPEEPEEKPKRGRPKKAEAAPEPEEPEEKPKRGRPKKADAES